MITAAITAFTALTLGLATSAPTPGKAYAIIVHVVDYPKLGEILAPPDLPGTNLDAANFIKSLGEDAEGVILSDVPGVSKLPPTRENILRESARIAQQAGPSDSVWFFFSGHGHSADGYSYLVPRIETLDQRFAKSVGVLEIRKLLEPGQCRAKNKFIVLDACMSGSTQSRTGLWNGVVAETTGIVTMAAASVDKEAIGDTKRGGFFTYNLLRGLSGEAKGPDGVVRLGSLREFVVRETNAMCVAAGRSPQDPVFMPPGANAQIAVSPGNPQVAAQVPPPSASEPASQFFSVAPMKDGIVVQFKTEGKSSAGTPVSSEPFTATVCGGLTDQSYPVITPDALSTQSARKAWTILQKAQGGAVATSLRSVTGRYLLRGTVRVECDSMTDAGRRWARAFATVEYELVKQDGAVILAGSSSTSPVTRQNETEATRQVLKGLGEEVLRAILDKLEARLR